MACVGKLLILFLYVGILTDPALVTAQGSTQEAERSARSASAVPEPSLAPHGEKAAGTLQGSTQEAERSARSASAVPKPGLAPHGEKAAGTLSVQVPEPGSPGGIPSIPGQTPVGEDANSPPREETFKKGSIRLLGQGSGNVSSERTVAGSGALGFQYEEQKGYIRAKVNAGLSGIELKNEPTKEYASMILQPDIRGFSLALDGAYKLPFGRHNLVVGGAFRTSPYVNWTVEVPMTDPITMMPKIETHSNSIVTLGLVLGLGYLFHIEYENLNVAFEATGNFSMRALAGDATNDLVLMKNTLGTTAQFFLGGELRFKMYLNDVKFFMALPFLYVPTADANVEGLTGFRVLFGLEIDGNLWTREIIEKRPVSNKGHGPNAPPSGFSPPSPDWSPKFSL